MIGLSNKLFYNHIMVCKKIYLTLFTFSFLLFSSFDAFSQKEMSDYIKEYSIKHNLKLLKKNSNNKKTDQILHKIQSLFEYGINKDSSLLVTNYLLSKKKKFLKRPLYWSLLSNSEYAKENFFTAIKYYLQYCSLFKPEIEEDNGLISFLKNPHLEKTKPSFTPNFDIETSIQPSIIDVFKKLDRVEKENLLKYINSFKHKNYLKDHNSANLLSSLLYFYKKDFFKSFESYLCVEGYSNIGASSYDLPGNCYSSYFRSNSYKDLISIVVWKHYDKAIELLNKKIAKNAYPIDLYRVKFEMSICKEDYTNLVETFVKASTLVKSEDKNDLTSNDFFRNKHPEFKKILPKLKDRKHVRHQLKLLIDHQNIGYIQIHDLAKLFFANGDYDIAYDLVIKNLKGEAYFGVFDSPFEMFLGIPDKKEALQYIDKFSSNIPSSDKYLYGICESYLSLGAIQKMSSTYKRYIDSSIKNKTNIATSILNEVEFTRENKKILTGIYGSLLKKYPDNKEFIQLNKRFINECNYYTKTEALLNSAGLLNKGEYVTNKNFKELFVRVLNTKPSEFTLKVLTEYSLLDKTNFQPYNTKKTLQYIYHYKKSFSEKEIITFFDTIKIIFVDSKTSTLESLNFFEKAILPNKSEIDLIKNNILLASKLPIDHKINQLEIINKKYPYIISIKKVLIESYLNKGGKILEKVSDQIKSWQYIDPYDGHSYYLNAMSSYKMLFITTKRKDFFGTDMTNKEGSPFHKRFPYSSFIKEFEKALKKDSSLLSEYDFSEIIKKDQKTKELIKKHVK
jgi:hypothetical protein